MRSRLVRSLIIFLVIASFLTAVIVSIALGVIIGGWSD